MACNYILLFLIRLLLFHIYVPKYPLTLTVYNRFSEEVPSGDTALLRAVPGWIRCCLTKSTHPGNYCTL